MQTVTTPADDRSLNVSDPITRVTRARQGQGQERTR